MTTPCHNGTSFEDVELDVEVERAWSPRLLPAWVHAVPPVVQDSLLAVVLAATLVRDLAVQTVPPGGPARAADALGYVLVALLVLPLALRRTFPRSVFLIILVDAVAVMLLFYLPTSFGFGLIVATYTVARCCRPQISIGAVALTQGFTVFAKLRAQAAGFDVGWFEWPLDAVYMGSAWFLGRSLRSRHQYAVALEQSREALAQRAVQDERTRIARELHDAVGHSVSVMTLHVGAAEELVDKRPDRAKEAMAAAGEVGRGAMAEMDQLLGLLRSEDPEPTGLLQPSLANLKSLVEEFRDLGLDVKTTIDGEPLELPSAVDRSAFRIIQEALTNTLKHAGPTDAEITVTFSDFDVAVEVRDHGQPGNHAPWSPEGHRSQGIIGMRERVMMHDGELEVGRCEDKGFRVAARLPVTGRGRR